MNKFQVLWHALEGTEYAHTVKLVGELGDAMGVDVSACRPNDGHVMSILIRDEDGRKAKLSLSLASYSAHKFAVDPVELVEALHTFPELPTLIEELTREVNEHPIVDVLVKTHLKLKSTQARTREDFENFLAKMRVGGDMDSLKKIGVAVERVVDFQVEVI